MNTSIKIFILSLLLHQCTSKNFISRNEVLVAENNFFIGRNYDLTLYSDSTFLFNGKVYDDYEKISYHEEYKGRYTINDDTIDFLNMPDFFFTTQKAIIEGNFLEFINPRRPLKLRITETDFINSDFIDTVKYGDYALFQFDYRFYNCYTENDRPCKLNNDDLSKIDSLFNICIKKNSDKISLTSNEYFKQCIGVINSKNEKEVWVNCICKRNTDYDFRYNITEANDGGDCYIRLKINLSKLFFYNLFINGEG